MPRSLRLNIAEPCHENWQQMTPREQGRFCGSCQKTVVDFSMMSDQEVLNYFLNANHKVCGRFAEDQLNKELVITERKKRFSWAYVWNVILATFLLTEANAQVNPKARSKKPAKTISRTAPRVVGDVSPNIVLDPAEEVLPVTISGKVIDEKNNQPVIGASISIKNIAGGAMADSLGNFHFSVQKKDSLVLEFSAVGYETETRVIDVLTNWQDVQVFLKPAFTSLEEVCVVSYDASRIMGGAIGRVTYTRSEKIKKNINDWVPTALKKDVKIYPNPVVRGNYIEVSLSLKEPGDYRLDVLNAAGQIMQVQPVVMATKEQQVNIYTQSNWSAGVYWIRITADKAKSVYQSKFILQ